MQEINKSSAATIYHDDKIVIRLSNKGIFVHKKDPAGNEIKPLGYLAGANYISLESK